MATPPVLRLLRLTGSWLSVGAKFLQLGRRRFLPAIFLCGNRAPLPCQRYCNMQAMYPKALLLMGLRGTDGLLEEKAPRSCLGLETSRRGARYRSNTETQQLITPSGSGQGLAGSRSVRTNCRVCRKRVRIVMPMKRLFISATWAARKSEGGLLRPSPRKRQRTHAWSRTVKPNSLSPTGQVAPGPIPFATTDECMCS